MRAFVKAAVKKTKLAVLWVRRILLAPDHFRVAFPVKLWMNVHGFVADQYVLYDLRGTRRHEYLSEFDWYRSRWIDEPFDAMLNNKVVCTEVLAPHVLVPKILAVKTKGETVLCAEPETPADAALAARVVKTCGSAFMKPISAGKGKGVHRIDWTDGGFALDGAPVEQAGVEALLAREDGWFLCESMRQSAYLDALYAGAANTVRLVTVRDPETQAFKVLFAVQRIGTDATSPVDNGSRGGLVARIDVETGVLSEARSLHSREVHTAHPDTGGAIEGFCIPDWDGMKECALRLARLLPYVRFVAWDLLATDEGVCVIEANASSGVNIVQLWGPQKNGELGDYYRAQGVLK